MARVIPAHCDGYSIFMYRRPRDRELRQKILWRRRQIIGAELRNYLQSLTRVSLSTINLWRRRRRRHTRAGRECCGKCGERRRHTERPSSGNRFGGAYRGAVPDPRRRERRGKMPERDEQFARQRHDHCLARAGASIRGSRCKPSGQGTVLLESDTVSTSE
jgi:hypothetical protein